ncbi:MAG TPA: S53 family peptidase [Methanocella sp.]|nr:S53 family peptidase [Methanocella sp.]
MSSKKKIPIKGSERAPIHGARAVGPSDPGEQIDVTLILRHRQSSDLSSKIKEIQSQKPHERKYLSRDELAAARGADEADIQKIKDFAREYHLDVSEVNAAQRRVVLSGTATNMSEAFSVDLQKFEYSKGSYRGRTGSVQIPEDIAPIVEGVFGLDNRPQARPHLRVHTKGGKPIHPRAAGGSFTASQIAKLYGFPTGSGNGQCIGILEFGGGYSETDLTAYFAKLEIPKPKVTSVSVGRSANKPSGNPNCINDRECADTEVLLDIEVAGSVAPGANIAVYFARNTEKGFIDAINAAVTDKINKPTVISISWGGPENAWTPQARQAMDQAFQDAAALGITICCAAGDDGSIDGVTDGRLHVDYPGSSPDVLCCGGTRLKGSGTTITSESVWNDGMDGGSTGGGISDVYDLPDWQTHMNVPPSVNPGKHIGRGVPDVAGDADPATGYQVLVVGQWGVIGGTSAAAPLWAGLIAILNEELGTPVGFLNPILYQIAVSTSAFQEITNGDNDITGQHGPYQACAGWNPCTGLGSPNAEALLKALGKPPTPARSIEAQI